MTIILQFNLPRKGLMTRGIKTAGLMPLKVLHGVSHSRYVQIVTKGSNISFHCLNSF
jgi:hypothetical protein